METPVVLLRCKLRAAILTAMAAASLTISASAADTPSAPPQLKITYGSRGIEQLSYGSTSLENLAQFPSDAFHIWHMKMTDLQGKVLTQKQYGWGETNNGRAWDAATHSWTYNFAWGSIRLSFEQAANSLNMTVTETNRPGSGVILDGATIYPLGLHMPAIPRGFQDPHLAQISLNTNAPGVTLADFGSGEIAAVVADARQPLYTGFEPQGAGTAYIPIISSTSPDSLGKFQPHIDRPVSPGSSDTFKVSLRFAPSGTPLKALAADAYSSWSKTWPAQLHWTDRRPIGSVFLASAPSGDAHRPAGFASNPRRYFSDAGDFNINTASGLAAFQTRVLEQAETNVFNLKHLGAQGAITWDIEGQQYPQDTSYICAPDQIPQVAPEMESIITDTQSPYHGMRLDDAYFRIMTSAGFRVGVCVRPQHLILSANGSAQQVYLPLPQVEAELARKMRFAHDRWGVTLFYVDSSVERDGAVLDATIFQHLGKAFPDSLIIPEESTPKHYAYTAPFLTFLFHGDTGTNPEIYAYYPQAFSVNLINDADVGKLATSWNQLEAAVRHGDALVGLVQFWQTNNQAIQAIYRAAHAAAKPAERRFP